MKKISILLLCFFTLAACGKKPQPAPAQEEVQNTREIIVAQIGPVQITQEEFDRRIAQLSEEDQEYAKTAVGRRNFLDLMAREKLIVLDAQDEELDKADFYLTSLDDKRRQLDDIYKEFADDLLVRMWETSLLERGVTSVTDEEIAAYFDKYPYEMTIKQIIISDAQTADIVYRELKRAKNRWKELERQYSTAPEQSQGKAISFMPGEFIPELEVIAANSSSGSVQGFFKTAQGFHIIMKTGEKRLSLKDAAPRIRAILENQKTDAALNALKNKYKVVIYEQDE